MLGFIEGKIISKNPDTSQCIVLAGQVGYEVTVPKHVFEQLAVDVPASLWLHAHVREDAFTLFGFSSEPEKHFFRVLLGMSGLGPQKAMSLLTEHGASKLIRHILSKDTDSLSSAPGVGKKLAQKIVLELYAKVEKLAWVEAAQAPVLSSESPLNLAASPVKQLRDDLTSALENFGYHPTQIKLTLDRMFDKEDAEALGFEACFKSALQEMSRR